MSDPSPPLTPGHEQFPVEMHRHIRMRAEVIAHRRLLSLSQYLEELVKADLIRPAASLYDPPPAPPSAAR